MNTRIASPLLTLLFFFLLVGSSHAQQLLWQIGEPDNDLREFALAPGSGDKFVKDGFFVVGRSDVKTDWPFSQPGPQDSWAGDRKHTYTIVFGLDNTGAGDSCTLQLKLLDVGPSPVRLDIAVNGQVFHASLPEGAGGAIYGDAAKGKKQELAIRFPAPLLQKGENTINITTVHGSWLVYDWLGLSAPAGNTVKPVRAGITLTDVTGQPFIAIKDGRNYQTGVLSFVNTGAAAAVTVNVNGMAAQQGTVGSGLQPLEILLPEVSTDSTLQVSVLQGKKLIGQKAVTLKPVRKITVYVLPHSHNDIGYTEIQSDVEKKQINNLLKGIDFAKKTKNYPEGARFVWNLEGVYAADLFLQRMGEQQKQDLYAAVRDGGVALNGMYLNTLTGLCRPEELLRLFGRATQLGQQFNVKVDAAMISDVPGYTWGTITAMAQAGIKYFSAAPNYFDRIGNILVQWEDKPFYWVAPSGKEKLLVWIPYRGYALSHGLPGLSESFAADYMNQLTKINYPYDITYVRWSGHGDNAEPEISISDFVKDFNTKYAWPKFIISSTSTAFSAFEKRYGGQLPSVKGDWTGYWEDGAGSSALETALNRASSSRLSQAEALYSIRQPERFPVDSFRKAWQQVILYSEHTWGADCSVTRPLSQKTKEQWEIKKSYADTAHQLSMTLLHSALPAGAGGEASLDIYNTNSWVRSGLILLSPRQSAAGDVVKDASGIVVPSQRLSTGELAFVAKDVPPFAAKRFTVGAAVTSKRKPAAAVSGKTTPVAPGVRVTENSLDNGIISVSLDETTGAIKSLRNAAIDNNFADSVSGNNLNDYLFLHGNNLADLQRNGRVKISIKEKGAVLATLSIVSDAPGCNSLTREIRLVNGFDYVDMTNILDKKPAELNPNPGDYAWANVGGKESVNFGFPFHVTDGTMKLDIPMAIMQPEIDQIPSACKNWLEVGGWADVSNQQLGITWASLDAPLVEVGGITATMLGGQTNPAVWRKKINPTQKLYSWAINNHWETNYRAYQDGIITFRYALRPHKTFEPVEATQFSTGLSQPLVIAPADASPASSATSASAPISGGNNTVPKLRLSSKQVIVQVLKPSDDGKAWIISLFNPSAETQRTALQWSTPVHGMSYSNTAEVAGEPVNGDIEIAAQDVMTVRVEK
jgi:hypothetical protein